MKAKFKIWLEEKGGVAFAEGRRMLLESIDRLGSLNAAAKELGMSYRAAWGKIKATEKALGIKLLEVTTGGKGGGGATLTPHLTSPMESSPFLPLWRVTGGGTNV